MIRSLAAGAFPYLLTHLWDSTLFLMVMLCVAGLARGRVTAGARFSVALIGILKFAIPTAMIAALVRPLWQPSAVAPLPLPLQVIRGALRFASRPVSTSVWPALVLAVWALIAVACIVRFALTRHRLVAIAVRTATPAQPREIDALARAVRRIGVRRSMDIARSALPEAPAVLRIVRPLIVLPARGCEDLSDDELESLLCHEIAHVARYDNLVARVESLICALFWFHPLIWIAQRVTAIERERACDEVVAGSADERKTYLAALTKFCHSAIAPRLPGVSCMATSKLKERIDHVMNYPDLKAHSPSPARVTVAAAAALMLFTIVSAVVGTDRAFARTGQRRDPYAIRLTATRLEGAVLLQGTITENATHAVLWAPKVNLDPTRTASAAANVSGIGLEMKTRADAGDRVAVDIEISKDGSLVQRSNLTVAVSDAPAPPQKVYQGEPISLALKEADLRDLLGTFGKITGLQMQMDDSVHGKVSVSWVNVPWDEALESILNDNGLTYRIEGKVVHISKK